MINTTIFPTIRV